MRNHKIQIFNSTFFANPFLFKAVFVLLCFQKPWPAILSTEASKTKLNKFVETLES